jgi:hypothetical protein
MLITKELIIVDHLLDACSHNALRDQLAPEYLPDSLLVSCVLHERIPLKPAAR